MLRFTAEASGSMVGDRGWLWKLITSGVLQGWYGVHYCLSSMAMIFGENVLSTISKSAQIRLKMLVS